jgi:hypothetical protein
VVVLVPSVLLVLTVIALAWMLAYLVWVTALPLLVPLFVLVTLVSLTTRSPRLPMVLLAFLLVPGKLNLGRLVLLLVKVVNKLAPFYVWMLVVVNILLAVVTVLLCHLLVKCVTPILALLMVTYHALLRVV